MWRLIALLLGFLGAAHVRAEPLRITTWNLNSSVVPAAISTAEENRLAGIASVLDSMNADVILLQETRDRQTCERLAAMLRTARYRVAVCSAFTDDSGHRLPQVAILSRRPIKAAWTEPWKADGAVTPPGGFAFALVHHGSGEVGIFNVQLKNNATNGDFEQDSQLNILKREVSAAQLLQHADSLGTRLTEPPSATVLAGSFNTNPDDAQFVSEMTLQLLQDAGFKSVFHGAPLEDRITSPGNGRELEATLDYVFARNAGFLARPSIVASGLSERFPVGCEMILRPAVLAAKVAPPAQWAANWQSVCVTLVVVVVMFCWWWVLGRKRFYSPALAMNAGEAGSAKLTFSDGNGFPASPDAIDEIESDDTLLPIQNSSRSQIQSLEQRAASAEQRAQRATDLVRKGMVPHLAHLMKDRLFRGVASQRAHLLLTQQAGADRMAELEQRLVKISSQMQDRFGAYERRIAELEQQVIAKDRINRELIDVKEKMRQALAASRIREGETQNIRAVG